MLRLLTLYIRLRWVHSVPVLHEVTCVIVAPLGLWLPSFLFLVTVWLTRLHVYLPCASTPTPNTLRNANGLYLRRNCPRLASCSNTSCATIARSWGSLTALMLGFGFLASATHDTQSLPQMTVRRRAFKFFCRQP